jgi:hypothetical protein
MAISTSSITLAQYALTANNPLIQKVALSLLQLGNVMEDWPLLTDNAMKQNGVRITGNLPTINWRKLNESSTTFSGTPQQFAENAYIVSGMIDADRFIVADKNSIQDPRATQLQMFLAGWTYDMNDKFFNNNHSSGDVDAFVGLRQRLDDTSTWGTNSACKINAGALDISDSGLSTTSANALVSYLEQMLGEIGDLDGNNVVFYMNRNMGRRVGRAIRQLGAGGGFEMTSDTFGRRITTFRNAKVKVLGTKADQSTEIITNTETSAGANGSSVYSSIYAVKYGEGYIQPWQFNDFAQSIYQVGMRSDEPTQFRIAIDYAVGILQTHTRAVVRAYGFKVA